MGSKRERENENNLLSIDLLGAIRGCVVSGRARCACDASSRKQRSSRDPSVRTEPAIQTTKRNDPSTTAGP